MTVNQKEACKAMNSSVVKGIMLKVVQGSCTVAIM